MIATATNVLVLSAWLAATLFVGRFLLTTWYKRTAGVVMMAIVSSAFSILSLAAITAVLGRDWPFREPVRLGVYILLNGLLWAGLAVLVRDQRRAAGRRVR